MKPQLSGGSNLDKAPGCFLVGKKGGGEEQGLGGDWKAGLLKEDLWKVREDSVSLLRKCVRAQVADKKGRNQVKQLPPSSSLWSCGSSTVGGNALEQGQDCLDEEKHHTFLISQLDNTENQELPSEH